MAIGDKISAHDNLKCLQINIIVALYIFRFLDLHLFVFEIRTRDLLYFVRNYGSSLLTVVQATYRQKNSTHTFKCL